LKSKSSSPPVRKIVAITFIIAITFLFIAISDLPQFLTGSNTASNQIMQSPTSSIDDAPPSNSKDARSLQGEPYHDPDPFCDLNPDSEIRSHNRFPSHLTVGEIIAKRSEPAEDIPMCPGSDAENYNQHRDLIAKLPPNYVRYTNRCQINAVGRRGHQFGGLPSGDPILTNLSTQIAFLHVYKAGGTTVRDTINAILPGLKRTTWHQFRKHIFEFMSHLFVFSHIRDPVSRAISSFFELHRRNETDLRNNHMVGMDSFHFMLSMMEDRMRCAMRNDTLWMGAANESRPDDMATDIYFNLHIMPQMWFLTAPYNPWRPYPVNYVGNITEIIQSTFDIAYHFYWNSSLYLEAKQKRKTLSEEKAWKEWNRHYHHGRNRHYKKYVNGGERKAVTKGNDVMKYQIEVDDLEEEDVRRICELYWMDYICIPFPIPAACNLTDLILKHYGDDVVYRDCWKYETVNEWDPAFYAEYVNGSLARKRQEKLDRLKQKSKKSKNSKKHKS